VSRYPATIVERPGTIIAVAPRTDPHERHYRIRLLPSGIGAAPRKADHSVYDKASSDRFCRPIRLPRHFLPCHSLMKVRFAPRMIVTMRLSGPCALCLEQRDLKRSHLIPSAVYKLLRAEAAKNPNPIHLSEGNAYQSSRQPAVHLLCDACEQILHQLGENEVLPHCFQEGKVKILSSLEGAPPVDENEIFSVYDLPLGHERLVSAFLHFVAGVIWKSSVWPQFDGVSLGPYREILRNFVLGIDTLPESIAIQVHAARAESTMKNIVWVPTTTFLKQTRVRVHHFAVPGLKFSMFVGQHLPPAITAWDIRKGRIIVIDWDRMALNNHGEAIAGARPVGALAKTHGRTFDDKPRSTDLPFWRGQS